MEDNIEFVKEDTKKQVVHVEPEPAGIKMVPVIKVGDGFEIRGIRYLVAAINKDSWLILQPYVAPKKKEGILGMMDRLKKKGIKIVGR